MIETYTYAGIKIKIQEKTRAYCEALQDKAAPRKRVAALEEEIFALRRAWCGNSFRRSEHFRKEYERCLALYIA